MKLEFYDYKNQKGSAIAEDGQYSWNYSGDVDTILSALISAEKLQDLHGRNVDENREYEIEHIKQPSVEERVKYVRKRLQFDGNVHAIFIDDERVA